MKLPVYLFVLSLLAVTSGAEILYQTPDRVEEAVLIDSDAGGTTVEFNLLSLQVEEDRIDEFGTGSVFTISGGDHMGLVGSPDLPVIRRMVLVPDMGEIELEIIQEETVPLGNFTVLPTQEFATWSGPEPQFRIDHELYRTSSFFPSSSVTLESVGILRDLRVAWVVFSPVRTNPVTGEAILTTSVTVRVKENGFPGENELTRPATGYTRSFLPVYQNVLGFENNLDTVDGSYVFIGSEESIALAQDLINWKAQKGYNVEVGLLSEIGSGVDDIHYWLENGFNTWPNPPEYVMLVGDDYVVPTPQYNGSETHAADNIYAQVGGGPLPSMHIGRICGSDTEDLGYIAWKIMMAESNPYQPTGDSWFNHAFSMACTSPMNAAVESLMLHELFQANALISTFYCDALGGEDPTLAAVTADINSGLSVMNYIGHGDINSWITSGFSISHMSSLTNGRKMPWVFTVGCQNGEFDGQHCFCEAFLSAGSEADPKGAVTVMGSSTYTPIGPGDTLQIHTFRGYFTQEMHHLGAAHTNGKVECYNSFGSSGVDMINMAHVFGCPETDIYSDTSPIAVLANTHSATVSPGTFQVTVTDDADGAVEGALVGVYCEGTNELLASEYTAASGVADLTIASVPAGEAITITSTAHNRVPAVTWANGTSVDDVFSGTVDQLFFSITGDNPAMGTASFNFSLPGSGFASVQIFDLSGRLISTLLTGDTEPGVHSLTWDGTSSGEPVASGIYFATACSPYGSSSRSLILLK